MHAPMRPCNRAFVVQSGDDAQKKKKKRRRRQNGGAKTVPDLVKEAAAERKAHLARVQKKKDSDPESSETEEGSEEDSDTLEEGLSDGSSLP